MLLNSREESRHPVVNAQHSLRSSFFKMVYFYMTPYIWALSEIKAQNFAKEKELENVYAKLFASVFVTTIRAVMQHLLTDKTFIYSDTQYIIRVANDPAFW